VEVYDAGRVHAALPYPDLIAALAQAHARDIDANARVMLDQPGAAGRDHLIAQPAWQRGRALGAKLITVFPANETAGAGLPSVQGIYALFDGRDGRPLAVIDGAAITLRKTAADSALGARLLAREDAARMLMVGAGALAPHLIQAHVAARPSLREVQIWNRTGARAAALAADLALPGVALAATADLEGAARRADVISCATMATEPLILGDWLQPGAHLDLVGSYRPDMRECDDAALTRGRVFVDSPWNALETSGEIVGALASGALRRADILGDLFTLTRGTARGRRDASEITVFKNGGGGHLDLMVAQHLAGLGV